jgi:hypothetical protein
MVSCLTGERVVFAQVSAEIVRALAGEHASLCLSLAMPTHRRVPDKLGDRPAFRHLVESLGLALAKEHHQPEVDRQLEPFRQLEGNAAFWEHTRDGLVVLAADGMASVFILPVAPRPLALVGRRFHTLPLVRVAAGTDRYDVLTLTSHSARVYEGCRRETADDTLDPVPLHGFGGSPGIDRDEAVDVEVAEPHRVHRGMGRSGLGYGSVVHGGAGSRQDDVDDDTVIFLRHVDEVVHERVSRVSGLPLVLAALPRLAAVFRGLSKNWLLLDEGVARDVHLVPPGDLPALVAPIFAAARERRIVREIARYAEARDRGLGSGDLSDIARAAVAGRVAVLLVEKDRFEPGLLDRATGGILPADGPAGGPPVDLSSRGAAPAFDGEDLYGALAETVMLHGGGILAVDRIAMPTESGVAAIYRYG